VQNVPLRQSQFEADEAFGDFFAAVGACSGAVHILLLPLIEPSLHMNLPLAQCAIPPFLPEQGLFWAWSGPASMMAATSTSTRQIAFTFFPA
jgi:hypothetical protein